MREPCGYNQMRSIHDSLTITTKQWISLHPSPLKTIHIVSVRHTCVHIMYWGLHHSQNNYDWIISAVIMACFSLINNSDWTHKHQQCWYYHNLGWCRVTARDLPLWWYLQKFKHTACFQLQWLVCCLSVCSYLTAFFSYLHWPQCSVAKDLP